MKENEIRGQKELKKSKPKPYKKKKSLRTVIIDDFGTIRSGEFLNTRVIYLSFLSVLFLIATIIFFYLYYDSLKKYKFVAKKIIIAEKKNDKLIQEKEVLMAKIVMLKKQAEGKPDEVKNSKGKKSGK